MEYTLKDTWQHWYWFIAKIHLSLRYVRSPTGGSEGSALSEHFTWWMMWRRGMRWWKKKARVNGATKAEQEVLPYTSNVRKRCEFRVVMTSDDCRHDNTANTFSGAIVWRSRWNRWSETMESSRKFDCDVRKFRAACFGAHHPRTRLQNSPSFNVCAFKETSKVADEGKVCWILIDEHIHRINMMILTRPEHKPHKLRKFFLQKLKQPEKKL